MTVKQLKKYLELLEDDASLLFQYKDEADYGSEYCMVTREITSVEIGDNFMCFLNVEEAE